MGNFKAGDRVRLKVGLEPNAPKAATGTVECDFLREGWSAVKIDRAHGERPAGRTLFIQDAALEHFSEPTLDVRTLLEAINIASQVERENIEDACPDMAAGARAVRKRLENEIIHMRWSGDAP